MIYGIDNTVSGKLKVYATCVIVFVILGIYAAIWIKQKMKRKMFRAVPVKEVMAMENKLDHQYHK